MAKPAPEYITDQPRTTDLGPILEDLDKQIEEAKERLYRLIGQREMALRLVRLSQLAQQGAVVTNGVDA
jgi:hypothetical protein